MQTQRSIAAALVLAAGCHDDSRDASGAGFGVLQPAHPNDPEATGSDTSAATGDAGDGEPTTAEPPAPACGDGRLDPGEQCDDGDANGPHAPCHADCKIDVCGDGLLGPGEDCDLGAANGPDGGCSAQCGVLPSACGEQAFHAELVPRPVDVVFVIDNSGSMADEIAGVEAHINEHFAAILGASGLDYRVVMLSRFGHHASNDICIESPLAGIPEGGCAAPPFQPVFGPRFFHYSAEIDSTNSWCRILDTLGGAVPDVYKLAPTGWHAWLRPGAFKIFVAVTDDRVDCFHDGELFDDFDEPAAAHAAALAFDVALRSAAPEHFGALDGARNYRFYSVAGVAPQDAWNEPYGPDEPLVLKACETAVNPGLGHQDLSVLTGGLRFPACAPKELDKIFGSLAAGVIADVDLACALEVPPLPDGKTLDPASLSVRFTAPKQQGAIEFTQVPGPAACTGGAYWFDGAAVVLCPETCIAVQQEGAALELAYACLPLQPG